MGLDMAIEAAAWVGALAVMAAHYQCCSETVSERAKYRWQWAHLLGPIALLAMAASKQAWPAAALNVFWAAVAARALLIGPAASAPEPQAAAFEEGEATQLARAAASELAAMGVGEAPAEIESVIESAKTQPAQQPLLARGAEEEAEAAEARQFG